MKLDDVTNYEAAVSYCLEIPRFTKKNSTEITKAFYEYLGKPGKASKIVHVAGTNGKGSVCAFLQSICMQMNVKVGMFTSPHLCDIRERVRIDGEWISKETFLNAFLQLGEKLQNFCAEKEAPKEYHPSFFEWLFFIGMLCFEKESPDVILLETGLGGRLDATNCIEAPAVTVITKIGFDHMEYLGETIEAIASEKAGILKPGIPVVYLKDKKEADEVIVKKARRLSCPCVFVSKDEVNSIYFRDKRIDFSYKSRYYGYVKFSVGTTAFYQVENAIAAVAAAEELFQNFSPSKENADKEIDTSLHKTDFGVEVLQKGVAAMHWEGRMEEVMPGVFLDGAHNEDGIDAFLDSVSRDGCQGNRSLLFSAVSDKQYAKMAGMITDSGLFSQIYTAPIDSARGVETEKLEQLFEGAVRTRHMGSPHEALQEMLKDRGVDDYLYVAGSLYLIGQLKEWLKGNLLR